MALARIVNLTEEKKKKKKKRLVVPLQAKNKMQREGKKKKKKNACHPILHMHGACTSGYAPPPPYVGLF